MAIEILGLKLFTVQESAYRLQITPKVIKRYLREGVLLGYQIKETWFIPAPCLRAFESVNKQREIIKNEALKLKGIFDSFLEKGDITQGYYEEALERLADFLPG